MNRNLNYTLEQYDRALGLKNKYPYRQIAKTLNIPAGTIAHWFWEDTKPSKFSEKAKRHNQEQGKFLGILRTKKLPNSAKVMSVELAYILGVVYGDGTFGKNEVKLGTPEKEFTEIFKENLEKWAGLGAKLWKVKAVPCNIRGREIKPKYKYVWVASLCSKEAKKFLKNFDLNKIRNTNDKTKGGFIRGFFDSEGGVYFPNKKRKGRPLNIRISCCNTNFNLISFVEDLLNSLNIKTHLRIAELNKKKYKTGGLYILNIRSKSFKTFKQKVSFMLSRKKRRLDMCMPA